VGDRLGVIHIPFSYLSAGYGIGGCRCRDCLQFITPFVRFILAFGLEGGTLS
jgi:hypothetical protein